MKDNTNIHFSHMDWDKQWDPEWLIHVLYLTTMWCHNVTYLTMMSDQASSWSSTEKQTKGNVISSVSDLFWSILTQQSCYFVITLAMLVVYLHLLWLGLAHTLWEALLITWRLLGEVLHYKHWIVIHTMLYRLMKLNSKSDKLKKLFFSVNSI